MMYTKLVRTLAAALLLAQFSTVSAQEAPRAVPRRRLPRPVPAAEAAPGPPPKVFALGEDGLSEVPEHPRSLAALGVDADALATVLVPVKHLDTNQIVEFFTTLPDGSLWCRRAPDGQTLLISGRAAAVDYGLKILSALDTPKVEAAKSETTPPPERAIGIIQVEHADVEALASMLSLTLDSEGAMSPMRRTRSTRGVPSTLGEERGVRIVADSRTSKLIVQAHDTRVLEKIRAIVRELDVPVPSSPVETTILSLNYRNATELAKVVAQLLGSFSRGGPPRLVVPHEATNSLLVQADAETVGRIRELVEKLDVPMPKDEQEESNGGESSPKS